MADTPQSLLLPSLLAMDVYHRDVAGGLFRRISFGAVTILSRHNDAVIS